MAKKYTHVRAGIKFRHTGKEFTHTGREFKHVCPMYINNFKKHDRFFISPPVLFFVLLLAFYGLWGVLSGVGF